MAKQTHMTQLKDLAPGSNGVDVLPENEIHNSLATTVEFMQRFHAEEIFGTPEDSKTFLDSLNFSDFKRWIGFVNGVEREIPRSERGFMGASIVWSESPLLGSSIEYNPPREPAREPLMEAAFKKAQSVDDPKYAGLTLGFAINAIHPYPDGNGRTARMVTALLSHGYDGSYKDNAYYDAILKNQAGREVLNPNPHTHGLERTIAAEMYKLVAENLGFNDVSQQPSYLMGGYGGAMAGEETPNELEVSDTISDAGRRELHLVMSDSSFGALSFMRALGFEGLVPFIKINPRGAPYIDAATLIPTLTMDDIVSLAKSSAVIKNSYVKRLIDFSDRDDASEIVETYLDSQKIDLSRV